MCKKTTIEQLIKNRYLKQSQVLMFGLILTIFFNGGCSNMSINNDIELSKIEETIHNTVSWAITKDFELLYGIIADDTNYLEVHPSATVIKGIDEFRKLEKFWRSDDFKAIGHELHDLKITLSKSKDVAWFYCILDDINEWKGESSSWLNTRWTGVLEKRNGKWRMVQMHFSFATD
jgi:hypothetical protein